MHTDCVLGACRVADHVSVSTQGTTAGYYCQTMVAQIPDSMAPIAAGVQVSMG